MSEAPFWQTKTLEEMTPEEWESLCDGCGKCCLLKVQYDGEDEILPTCVSCRLLDTRTCRCSDYPNRKVEVPDCTQLTPENVRAIPWLPRTCAYRLLAEGRPLEGWHPLVSGSRESVHRAGVSVRFRVISEDEAGDDLEDWITDWRL